MKIKGLWVMLFCTILMLSGCTSNLEVTNPPKEEVVKSGSSGALSREQSLTFNCIATDGLAAYSLMQLIYEQPEIMDSVKIEYTLYSEEYLTMPDVDKKKDSFAILPIELAVETMLRHDAYKLVGVIKTDGASDYKLGVLITSDILELHPEFAVGFVNQYLESCTWVTSNPDRALAYAIQLNIVESEAPAKTFVYYNASRSVKAIGAFLKTLGYSEEQLMRVEAQTINTNEL